MDSNVISHFFGNRPQAGKSPSAGGGGGGRTGTGPGWWRLWLLLLVLAVLASAPAVAVGAIKLGECHKAPKMPIVLIGKERSLESCLLQCITDFGITVDITIFEEWKTSWFMTRLERELSSLIAEIPVRLPFEANL